MNVLFLASTLPRFVGDSQPPFVIEQAAAWKRARPDDNIIVLAPHDQSAARIEQIDGVEIERFQYFMPANWQALAYPAILPNIRRRPLVLAQLPFFLWREYAAAMRIVRNRKIDLIYAHWVMPQGVVAHRIHRRTGIPYALQNHSSDLDVFRKPGKPGRYLARSILQEARSFFCVQQGQFEAALNFIATDLHDEFVRKADILPMGVGLPIEQIGTSVAPHNADAFRYDFSCVSRLSKKKGLNHLITAISRLENEDLCFAIAGDGEDRDALKHQAENLAVEFPGFLTGNSKSELFDQSRFMVFSSKASNGDVEGMPVALLEALCCGKLCIASRDTNIEALPEWKQIREAVVLLDDPADTDTFVAAIRQLLALSPETVNRLSQRLTQTMRRYQWDNLINEYLGKIDLM